MGYLIYNDYKKQIQNTDFQNIISADPTIQTGVEQAAQEEIISYLSQKYDYLSEFTNTTQYDNTLITYISPNRVYLNANAYSATSAYAIGNLTLQNSFVYQCITSIALPGEAFNPAHWLLLGAQYALFYAQYPNPFFNIYTNYVIGNKVFWKGHNYTCLVATITPDQESVLQYGTYQNIPLQNSFPDDPVTGAQYWTDNGVYAIPAGSLLNTQYFTAGDNRSQQMVQRMIDITLYHIHCRIAPRNIPEIRVKRYDDAIDWLKRCAKGDITPNLAKLQPSTGMRIRYGGNIKNINSY